MFVFAGTAECLFSPVTHATKRPWIAVWFIAVVGPIWPVHTVSCEVS